MLKDSVNLFVDFKRDALAYFLPFADLKHLIEVERAESLAGQRPSLSTSESAYTDSYVEGSRDEIERLSNG